MREGAAVLLLIKIDGFFAVKVVPLIGANRSLPS